MDGDYFRIHFNFDSGCWLRQSAIASLKLGISNAQNLSTLFLLGTHHRNSAIVGKGTFGEVHKPLNIKDGKRSPSRFLAKEEREKWRRLISWAVFVMRVWECMSGAVALASGQACIVMELAINDLHIWRRKLSMLLQRIRSIGQQAFIRSTLSLMYR